MSLPAQSLHIAVLDDYNNLSFAHLAGLPAHLHVTVFRDTLLPHPDPRPLIKRLEPFDVVCTMRERTPLNRDVLMALPKLKVLLTTGMRNAGIDVEACEERGIILAGTPNFTLP